MYSKFGSELLVDIVYTCIISFTESFGFQSLFSLLLSLYGTIINTYINITTTGSLQYFY